MKKHPKNWLITGGCGFIGTSLIGKLVNNKLYDQIIVVDNLSIGKKKDLASVCDYKEYKSPLKKGIYFLKADILDHSLFQKITKNIDCIVHLAANTGVPESVKNPRLDMESNVIGTFNMLESARVNKIKQFVFASSGAPAGEITPPIHEEIAPHPVSPYGASKLSGEGYCSAYSKSFGINTVILRFGNVYGPGSMRKNSVVAKFIKNVFDNKVCEIYGDGSQTRDFIYIGDLIDAIIKSSRYSKGGEIFQIATGQGFTILSLVSEMMEIFEKLDFNMKVKYSEKRNGDVLHNFSDTKKASNELGWSVKTDIKEGLRKTITRLIEQKEQL